MLSKCKPPQKAIYLSGSRGIWASNACSQFDWRCSVGSANQRAVDQGTPPGRNRLSVPRGTVERKIEDRLCPMRVLDALARAKKPREKLAKLRLRIRQSVPRGTCQALRITIRCRAADSHCLHLRLPHYALRDGLCVPRGTSWLLKWVRKCWPIDCYASRNPNNAFCTKLRRCKSQSIRTMLRTAPVLLKN